jgi:hypothetical protein
MFVICIPLAAMPVEFSFKDLVKESDYIFLANPKRFSKTKHGVQNLVISCMKSYKGACLKDIHLSVGGNSVDQKMDSFYSEHLVFIKKDEKSDTLKVTRSHGSFWVVRYKITAKKGQIRPHVDKYFNFKEMLDVIIYKNIKSSKRIDFKDVEKYIKSIVSNN